MKVSVILPISNNYFDANRSIISLINQTYKNLEILICLNGNSKKYNTKIKKNFSEYKQVKFYEIEEKNIVHALNFLIEKSSGEFIARMDVDDVSFPKRIEKQVKYLIDNNLSFASTNGEVVDANFDKIYTHEKSNVHKYYTNPILHPSIIIEAKLLKKFKYKQIPYAEDYELYLRLEQSGVKLGNINETLIYYQLNTKNVSNPKRAFFLILSTLVIANAFRNNLSVNENFFKLVKYDNKFKPIYKDFNKNFIKEKKIIFKVIFLIKNFFRKNSLIKKILFSRFLIIKFKNKIINKKSSKIYINKQPFISIIVPTFNSEKTIIKTIKSILRQTYQNFEIIIIDNSYNLNTINLINKNYKSKKIKIFHIKKKILNGEARNIGVNKSSKKSKIIAFCDSDDWWKSNKIQKQIKIMKKEKAKISFTNYDFYNANTKKIIKNYFKIPFTTINFSMLAIRNLVGTSSVMVEKELFLKVGGFPESKFFYSFEDYFLWLKLASKNNFYFIDDELTIYRDDRKNSATKHSRSFISQRLRLIFYYLFKLNIKNLFKVIIANLQLLISNYENRKKRNKIEYFDLL